MKKEYIKPIIINIKICNDDALMNTVSLYDIGKSYSVEHIADEGDNDEPIHDTYDKKDIIWND